MNAGAEAMVPGAGWAAETAPLVLMVSIALQFLAAVFAFRLIRITGKRLAWTLIAVAVAFMAARRGLSLAEYFLSGPRKPPDLAAELLALLVSICMVLGVAFIAPIFEEMKKLARELGENERRFRNLVENWPDEIARYDRDCRRAYVNPYMEAILGYPNQELLGRTPVETYPGTLAVAAYEAKLREVLATGAALDFEMDWKSPTDTEPKCRLFRLVPERDEHGGTQGVFAIARDITELKRAEEALERKRSFLRTLLRALPDLIWLKNPDGVYLSCNRRFEQLFGAGEADILGKTDYDFVDPGLADFFREKDLAAIAAGRSLVNEEELSFAADGHRELLETIKTPLLDGQGRLIGVLGIARDITQRKRAEEQRRDYLWFLESMDRINQAIQGGGDLERMLDNALDAALDIFGCDRAFLLHPCDPDAASWRVPVERTRPEYPGVLALGLEIPMDPDAARTLRTALAHDGPVKFGPGADHPLPGSAARRFNIKSLMSIAIHPTAGAPWQFGIHQCGHPREWTPGEERLFQEIARRLGDTLGLWLAYRDLEQRVRKEVARNREKDHLLIQQARLAAMGEMIHNIAHQWRQPLNTLSLVLGNIVDDYDYHELTRESLAGAVAQAQDLIQGMSNTVDDFRDFFRPDREPGDFDIGQAVGDALAVLDAALAHHGIGVAQSLAGGCLAHGYPNQFAQAVLNLLVNAKEAILARGRADGLIDLRLERRGDSAVLTVRDNGGGIAAEVLPKVFDPYFTTKEQGSGIGLYMTKMILERNLGGTVALENHGAGTLATVTLPCLPERSPT